MLEQKSRAGCMEGLFTQMPLPHHLSSFNSRCAHLCVLSTVSSAGEIMKMTDMVPDLGG